MVNTKSVLNRTLPCKPDAQCLSSTDANLTLRNVDVDENGVHYVFKAGCGVNDRVTVHDYDRDGVVDEVTVNEGYPPLTVDALMEGEKEKVLEKWKKIAAPEVEALHPVLAEKCPAILKTEGVSRTDLAECDGQVKIEEGENPFGIVDVAGIRVFFQIVE